MKHVRGSAHFAKIDDDALGLTRDFDTRLPAPLDKRIASLILRSMTNNPVDGYDVFLSASFGTERVLLVSDEFEISVRMSILSASIELEFPNSDFTVLRISESASDESWKKTEHETRNSTKGHLQSLELRGEGTLNAVAGNAGLKAASGSSWRHNSEVKSDTISHYERVQSDWQMISGNTLKVGRFGKKLDGLIISDFCGWRVSPRSVALPSGVIARIKVREESIKFDDVHYIRAPKRLLQKVQDLIKPEHSKRREHFLLLLRMLAQRGLQHSSDVRDATIAMEGLLWRPHLEGFSSRETDAGHSNVEISGSEIEAFLASSEGYEQAALVALGVRKEFIAPTENQIAAPTPSRGAFVPQSSPLNAISAFEIVKTHPGQPRRVLDMLAGRNELRDLTALGLLKYKHGGGVRLTDSPMADAEITIKRAVSRMPSIKVAKTVLEMNPGASAADIADAVAITLDKQWAKAGTKQRHGAAIRRWALWLEPHLIDPAYSTDAAALVTGALRDQVKKGTNGKLRPEVEAELRKLSSASKPTREIAAELGVSHSSVANWQRKLGLRGPKRAYKRKLEF